MSIVERMAALNAKRENAEASKAKSNRDAMPQVAAWVDDARSWFGEDVKVLYAAENGKKVGTASEGVQYSNGNFSAQKGKK